MSNELVRGGFGLPERRPSSPLSRQSRAQRAIQQQGELDLARLAVSVNRQQVVAMLRKQRAENALRDVRDVADAARELADGDEFVAALLIPIVQEYAREEAHDVRTIGHLMGF